MAKMNFKDALNKSLQATKKYVDDAIQENRFSGDYNDLENRPCYDDSTFGTNVITFDGTIKETDEIIDMSSMDFAIKILDFPIQKENLIGKTAKLLRIEEGEVTYTLNENHFLDGSALGIDGLYVIFEGSAIVVFEDNVDLNGVVLNKGTYFTARKPGENPTHITYLEYEGEIKDIKQLDEKFIPFETEEETFNRLLEAGLVIGLVETENGEYLTDNEGNAIIF